MSVIDSVTSKPVIAVDIDEVLAYFLPAVANFHNETYESDLTAESFFSYEFHQVWGGTPEETNTKLDFFFESNHFKEKLNPIPHAYEALLEMKKHFDLHIVTSRQHKVEAATIEWINQHFPDIFTAIHLGNHYSREGKSRTKSEICHSINAVLLIDDSVKYAVQCVRDNVPVILFGNYAWNQIENEYGDIDFVKYSPTTEITEISEERDAHSDSVSGQKDQTTQQPKGVQVAVGGKIVPPHLVYRVRNWKEVLHLIYITFKIDTSSIDHAV